VVGSLYPHEVNKDGLWRLGNEAREAFLPHAGIMPPHAGIMPPHPEIISARVVIIIIVSWNICIKKVDRNPSVV
jgi:hypothetical protein